MRALCCVAILGTAFAARAEDSGIEFGVRAGYVYPVGDIDAETAFSDRISGFVPVGLEVGYRWNGSLYLGVFGEYGVGFTQNCDPAAPLCSAHSFATGVDLRLRLLPHATVTPWVGVSAGYEWLVLSQANSEDSATSVLRGFRLVGASLGVDFFATRGIALGPYVSASLGRYSTAHINGVDVPFDEAYHGFVQAGLRASFLP